MVRSACVPPPSRYVRWVFIALVSLLLQTSCLAQTPPDFIFEGGHSWNNSNPTAAIITSQNDSSTQSFCSGGTLAVTDSATTATGNSITLATENNIARPNNVSGVCENNSGYKFSIWGRNPADVDITTSGSAYYTLDAPGGSSMFYSGSAVGSTIFTAGVQHFTGAIVTSGSQSASASGAYFNTCSASTTKSFPAWPSVTYYRIAPSPSGNGVFNVRAGARIEGSGGGTVIGGGNQTISVAKRTTPPTAQITPPSSCYANLPATFSNASVDTDGYANQLTCHALWQVSGPESYLNSGTNNLSIQFTPPYGGEYLVNLIATDNEGDMDDATATAWCRPATWFFAGSGPKDDEEVTISCGGLGDGDSMPAGGPQASSSGGEGRRTMSASGAVNPRTGNASARINATNQGTRGSNLGFEIQVNSQATLGGGALGRQYYTAMRNAYFTYSISLTALGTDRYLIDSDGSHFSIGPTSGPPIAPIPGDGLRGTFSAMTGGHKLTQAGPPGDIWQAGNWTYEFAGTDWKLSKIIDPNGNEKVITYQNFGWGNIFPKEVTDTRTNRKLVFAYDSYPRLTRVTEPGGDFTSFFYNDDSTLSQVQRRNSSGTVIEKVELWYYRDFALNTYDRLKEMTKDGDTASKLTFSYVSQAAVGGKVAHLGNMSWVGPGGVTKSTGFDYAVSTSGVSGASYSVKMGGYGGWGKQKYYDSNDWLVAVKPPVKSGSSTSSLYSVQYDTDRNVSQVSDGSISTSFTYNARGKATQVDDNNGGVWNFTYAANGIDLTEISDSLGTLVELTYGDTNNPHLPTTITDGDGNTWTKTYNTKGQVLTIVPPSGSPTGTTTFEYEENTSSPKYGFLKKITNGAGNETQFTSYNADGNVTEIVQTPESGTNIAYQFAYDGAGRTTRVTQPDGKYQDYAYNFRKLNTITDEGGTVTAFDFCSLCGKLTGVDMPLSKSLSWTQDGDHRTTGFVDARGKETDYEYGTGGELKKTTYPDGSYIIYRYDESGRLKETEDTRGHKKQYAYDDSGRVEEIMLVPNGGTGVPITYNYRADGSVESVTDEVGTTSFSYTAGRKVSQVEYDWSASGLTNHQILNYEYYPDGLLESLEWKDGATTVASWTYDYDGAGRMREVTNSFGETTTFTYDGVGKLKTQTNQNGTSTTYAYNQQRGWPTQILHKLGTTPFASYDLEYDGGSNTVGNLTKVTELDSSEVEYSYDALSRLTGEVRTGTGAYTRSYEYDLAGNMTQLDGVPFATYDDANKISSLSGGSVSYDADGNMTYVSGAGMPATTLTWDVRNRLKRHQTPLIDVNYLYHANGKRVLQFPTGQSYSGTFYVMSGELLLGEVEVLGPTYAYTWGGMRLALVSQRSIVASSSLWLHFGAVGETRVITENGGAATTTYSYDAFGKLLNTVGSDRNPHKYGGQIGYFTDYESAGSLATSRWFLPNLARWSSRDPIKYSGGFNLYAYVSNNPIRYVDRSGLDPGDYFDDCDLAALDFANFSLPLSKEFDFEVGANFYRYFNGKCTYQILRPILRDGEKLPRLESHSYRGVCERPSGSQFDSDIHTHGNWSPEPIYSDDMFSPEDSKIAEGWPKVRYLVTPDGTVIKLRPYSLGGALGGTVTFVGSAGPEFAGNLP